MSKEKYSEVWKDLNRELREIERNGGGLPAALEALASQQRTRGFIKDDLQSVRRYRFVHPDDPARFFVVQYNPVRALRFGGAGTSTPPAGTAVKHGGCFLCRDNIRWQQRGVLMLNAGLTLTRYEQGGHPHQLRGHIPLWAPIVRATCLRLARNAG